MVLFLFDNVIYVFFYCYDYVFSLYIFVWLPWLRFFRAFSSVVRQNARVKPRKDGARPALFLIFVLFYVFFVLFYVFVCCSMYCLFCNAPCIICVYMCTEHLPPGGYPIAVKYIISYHSNCRFSMACGHTFIALLLSAYISWPLRILSFSRSRLLQSVYIISYLFSHSTCYTLPETQCLLDTGNLTLSRHMDRTLCNLADGKVLEQPTKSTYRVKEVSPFTPIYHDT